MKVKSIFAPAAWSFILLVSVTFAVFFVTILPLEWHQVVYRSLFGIIYFSAVFNMERNKRKRVLIFSLLVFIMDWTSGILDFRFLFYTSRVLNIFFFIYIVVSLITQVAKAKKITAKVILESINGYLLIGMVFAIIVAVYSERFPDAFSFHNIPAGTERISENFSEDLYFTFITLATVGYGDMLPLKPFARSLATLIGITGQLYVAIIIAMLVGKFASQRKED